MEVFFDGERFLKWVWFRYFRLAEEEETREKILSWYSNSLILLHFSYHLSKVKGVNLMHARHFFLVDTTQIREFKIMCFPTEKIIMVYSKNPTQGPLLLWQTNAMQKINEEDFHMHNSWCKRIIEKHGL